MDGYDYLGRGPPMGGGGLYGGAGSSRGPPDPYAAAYGGYPPTDRFGRPEAPYGGPPGPMAYDERAMLERASLLDRGYPDRGPGPLDPFGYPASAYGRGPGRESVEDSWRNATMHPVDFGGGGGGPSSWGAGGGGGGVAGLNTRAFDLDQRMPQPSLDRHPIPQPVPPPAPIRTLSPAPGPSTRWTEERPKSRDRERERRDWETREREREKREREREKEKEREMEKEKERERERERRKEEERAKRHAEMKRSNEAEVKPDDSAMVTSPPEKRPRHDSPKKTNEDKTEEKKKKDNVGGTVKAPPSSLLLRDSKTTPKSSTAVEKNVASKERNGAADLKILKDADFEAVHGPPKKLPVRGAPTAPVTRDGKPLPTTAVGKEPYADLDWVEQWRIGVRKTKSGIGAQLPTEPFMEAERVLHRPEYQPTTGRTAYQFFAEPQRGPNGEIVPGQPPDLQYSELTLPEKKRAAWAQLVDRVNEPLREAAKEQVWMRAQNKAEADLLKLQRAAKAEMEGCFFRTEVPSVTPGVYIDGRRSSAPEKTDLGAARRRESILGTPATAATPIGVRAAAKSGLLDRPPAPAMEDLRAPYRPPATLGPVYDERAAARAAYEDRALMPPPRGFDDFVAPRPPLDPRAALLEDYGGPRGLLPPTARDPYFDARAAAMYPESRLPPATASAALRAPYDDPRGPPLGYGRMDAEAEWRLAAAARAYDPLGPSPYDYPPRGMAPYDPRDAMRPGPSGLQPPRPGYPY